MSGWPSVPRSAWLIGGAALASGALVASAVWIGTPAGIRVPRPLGQVAASANSAGSAAMPTGSESALYRGIGRSGSAVPTSKTLGPSGAPVRISIPALSLTAPVVAVSAASGSLAVPDAITQVGWWKSGGVPGAPTGTAVLDGHVDSAVSGLGAMWSLRFAKPGELISLSLSGGAHVSYRITALRVYTKSALPASLFGGKTGAPALVLITCNGPFNRSTGHYADNVVVYGVPVRTI